MLKVGLTGGIGSGKSLVAQMFALLGVPVFDADDAAKFLMDNDLALKTAISHILGKEAYTNGRLNRPFVASVIFADKEKKEAYTGLVHPATIRYGREWMKQQTAPYIVKEAAIFFESGTHAEMDKMIGVYAPENIRLQRAMHRDGSTETTIRRRMANQMNEEDKMARCDYILTNDNHTALIPQVLQLHEHLLQLAGGY
ncbi:MAG: dephospho-CoA kinase [Edaphocola sp.]